MRNFLLNLIPYRKLIAFFLLLAVMCLFGTFVRAVYRYAVIKSRERKRLLKEKDLLETDFSECSVLDKNMALRQVVAVDGLNPNQLEHLEINDGGKTAYLRYFTVSSLPNRLVFAKTFRRILNYGNVTFSLFVDEITKEEASKQLDKQIVILDGEQIAAEAADRNRYRKIGNQMREAEEWAAKIESDDERFFYVGFLFGLTAESMDELDTRTDQFVGLARESKIMLTTSYGTQAEAHLSMGPFGRHFALEKWGLKSDCVKTMIMDHASLSTVYNYFQNQLQHDHGHLLGYNFDGSVSMFDPFSAGRAGYNCIFAGTTGSGKSTTMKTQSVKAILPDIRKKNQKNGGRVVVVDLNSPAGSDEGEYCQAARTLNGKIYSIRPDSKAVMNPFDLDTAMEAVYVEGRPTVEERETLYLTEKQADVVSILLMMITSNSAAEQSEKMEFRDMMLMQDITSEIVRELYAEIGIEDRKPETLYEKMVDGSRQLRRKKKMPTLSEAYLKLLKKRKTEENKTTVDRDRWKAMDTMASAWKNFVRELYYSERTLTRYSREEYEKLPVFGHDKYVPQTGIAPEQCERVLQLVGVRGYFDGQSTIQLDRNCAYTDIDISKLPPTEMPLAQWIAINFIHTNFIMRNSENPLRAEKLIAIYDEGHALLKIPYVADRIEYQYRTSRKRNVSIWLAIQQMTDLESVKQGKAILDNTATVFMFQHSTSSREFLKKSFEFLTESQLAMLFSLGGDPRNKEVSLQRKGECCIVENGSVYFCHIAYLPEVEAEIAETDPEKRAQLQRRKMAMQ